MPAHLYPLMLLVPAHLYPLVLVVSDGDPSAVEVAAGALVET